MNSKSGRPLLVLLIAIAVVFGLSFVPWSKLTGGFIKDFNLLSDLMPDKKEQQPVAAEPIDPELESAIAEVEKSASSELPAEQEGPLEAADSLASPKAAVNPVVDGMVVIEDYTQAQSGASHLRAALAGTGRPARIAVVGDSYIEGDIFTMNLRESLQKKYGGQGVGYMPLQSALTGFRISVKQTCKGWQEKDIRKKGSGNYKWLSGEYFVSTPEANTVFRGTSKLSCIDKWQNTRLLYISPSAGTITVTTDAGKKIFDVVPSENVAVAEVIGQTSKATISTDIDGLVALGAFLDGNRGVQVDNMSLRGNSGLTHRRLDLDLAAQLRQYVDYDMIIIEYGINALSSQQSDYTSYSRILEQIIRRVQNCYPNADILLMGIGDRGQKIDGKVASLPTAQAMVNAQRNAARRQGVLFWDTRKAMGGEDAVVSWRERRLINADYIHLNANGGKELSGLFIKALEKTLHP